VELGRKRILLKDALELAPGSVVDLEKLAEEPVDLYVNDLLIARGEVLVVNDCFCIRITEVMAQGAIEEEP
jgi:flagellar motor switch protein FliN/FliY